MATHKSAAKRHRQSLKKRERNRVAKSSISTATKRVVTLASSKGSKDETAAALRAAVRLIDKSAIHGQVHKNKARRQISRLTKKIAAIK